MRGLLRAASLVSGLTEPGCPGVHSAAVGWTVDDTSVARVDGDTFTVAGRGHAVVVGRAPGTTVVIATLLGDPSVKAAATVHVAASD